MKISNKLKNTRVVEFKEDYKIGKRVKPLFEKGSTHYMHYKTAETLKKSGAKISVSKYPAEEKLEKAKAAFIAKEKEAAKQ